MLNKLQHFSRFASRISISYAYFVRCAKRWAVLQAYRLGQHSLVQGADDFGYPVG